MSSIVFGVLLERGVVDEHVEPAERLQRLGHDLAREARLLDVAGDEQATPAFGLDAAPCVSSASSCSFEVGDGDVGAFAREQHRDRAADARVAAGDDRGEALELAAAAIVGAMNCGASASSASLPGFV